MKAGFLFKDPIPDDAKAYILSIILLGLPVAIYCFYRAFFDTGLQWLYLVAPTVAAAYFPIKIPLTKGDKQSLTVTVSEVFVFAAMLLFGPHVAATIAITEGLLSGLRVRVKRLYKQLFNVAQLALVSFITGHIFYQLSGQPVPLKIQYVVTSLDRFLVEIGLSGFLYFMLNSGMIALAMSLVARQPVLNLWKGNFLWASVGTFAGAFLGGFIFRYFEEIQFYSIAVVIPILLVVYYGHRSNLDRIKQAQQHIDEVNALLAEKTAAEKALQKAKDELEVRVLDRTIELRNANQQLLIEINERRLTEKALASEKERLAVTLSSIADGVITTDTECRVFLMNKVAEEVTGWTQADAFGQQLFDVFNVVSGQTRERLDDSAGQVLKTGERILIHSKDTVLIARDNAEKAISHSLAPIRTKAGRIAGLVVVFRDITEQLKMEEEILRVQKLDSLGILAGGIAHDFNNILSGILMKTQLAQRAVTKGRDAGKYLGSIEEATQLATGLTRQLLTFAKGGDPIKETASIKDLLVDSAIFSLRGSKTRCVFHISDDLLPVQVDKGQISQVLNNLVINAAQAMPHGGRITVRAENLEVTEQSPMADLPSGHYVKVAVQDEGVGISAADMARIFDPYFSTKPKGHGLGLTTTHSIIEKHGGRITVESEVGKGSTFTFYLPAASGPPERKTLQQQVVANGHGRILVMDDEEIIREGLGDLLEELGYRVEFAGDGREAIASYREALDCGQRFDALIMDLTIPGGMGGQEAIRQLLELDPKATAIVSSGYSKDPVLADYKSYGFRAMLAKPFRIEEVSRVLAEVLEPKVRLN